MIRTRLLLLLSSFATPLSSSCGPVVCFSTIRAGPVSGQVFVCGGSIFEWSHFHGKFLKCRFGSRGRPCQLSQCCCLLFLAKLSWRIRSRRESQPRTLQRADEHTNDVHVWKSQSSDVLANAAPEQRLLHCEDCFSSFCHVLVDDLENVTWVGTPLQGARFSKSKAPTAYSNSSAHTGLVFIGFYQVFRSFRIPETFSAIGSRSVFIGFYQVFRSFRIPETFSAIGSRSVFLGFYQVFRSFRIPETFSAIGSLSVFIGFYQVFRSFRIPETIPETFSAIGLRVHKFCFHCFFACISELSDSESFGFRV